VDGGVPASRIRVALIIARLNIGGPATHVVQLAAGLPAERFEVCLIAGREGRGEGSMRYLAEKAGITPIWIPELSPALAPSNTIAFWKILRQIRHWRPDIVHTHTAMAGALGRTAAHLAGVPVVVHTFHGHVLRGYFSPPAEALFRAIERSLARHSDRLITLSSSLREDLVALRVAPRGKIQVIPLGMEFGMLLTMPRRQGELRRELAIPEDVPLVGSIGRLVPIKNHALLLRAARRMVDLGTPAQFVIVGDGELRAQLEHLSDQFGLETRVHFLGWRENLPPIYSDLDLLALTSENEGTPVAVLEAMAAGVPVVATSVGGVPDVIRAGETGTLVDSQEAEAFARAMGDALRDTANSRAMAHRARSEVSARFGKERMLAETASLYELLLASKRTARRGEAG
jgi:glycosyltransferase involved in cell wall biosynthesis